ncbi:hypothetical protein [Candidatus Laterigemmans baculatus]|uniref:hypothetical protein n=1 Tax=Candidatus Laterigemmans baculatus TaxID=2770505 RepID=UPI0013D91883|nr:hypothetical protein [Candidatus Laterigemmans baculatus]
MQRRTSRLLAAAFCGCFALPALVGCDAGDQQVRDDVIRPETFEGENVEVDELDPDAPVNLDVQNPDGE